MARLAVGVVGAAVGFYLGGPAGASIGWSLGAAAGGFLFPEQGQNVEGARLDDLRVMGSSYGVPIPIVYGAMRVPGNVIWAANLREIRTEEDLGGKGGPSATQVSYSYTGTFAVALCEGPIAAVTRVWANGKCVYDVRNPANTEALVASGNWVSVTGMRVYLGTESQLPDPAIEAVHGVGTTPAHRGLAYVVFENMPLEQFGNALPRQLDFEVVTAATAGAPLTRQALRTDIAPTWQGAESTAYQRMPLVQITDGLVRVDTQNASPAQLFDLAAAPVGTAPASADAITRNGVPPYPGGHWVPVCYAADGVPVFALPTSGGTPTSTAAWELRQVSTVGPSLRAAVGAPANSHLAHAIPSRSRTALLVVYRDLDAGTMYRYTLLSLVPAVAVLASGLCVDGATTIGTVPGCFGPTARWALTYAVGGQSAGVLEDDLVNLWLAADFTTTTEVSLYTINADTTLSRVGILSHANGITQGALPGIDATAGLAAVARKGDLSVFTRGAALTPVAPTLPAVVGGICARAGLTAGQIDTTLLSGTVEGVAYTRGGSGRSMLDSLRAAYWFDAVESGAKIRFVPRGGAPVAALTLDDLVAGDDGAAVNTSREHDDALPERVAVAYAAAVSDYRVGSQQAVRTSLTADSLRSIELPLALSDARAAQAAQVALADAWMGRTARTLTLMPQWAAIEPTDVIDLTDATRTARLRVVRKSEALGEGIRLEVVDEEAALYTPSATAGTLPGTGNSPALAGPTRVEVLDIPPLRDADNAPAVYAALGGYLATWRGGVLTRSDDGGASYATVGAASTGVVMGTAEVALPEFDGGQLIDEASVLEVSVGASVTLASCTTAQLLAGVNAAVVGAEVLGFRTATLLSAGRYRLTGLLRGRKGTPQSGHAIGERFVMLSAALLDVPCSTGDLGRTVLFKGLTVGAPAGADAASIAATLGLARLKPLAPVHVSAGRLGNGDVAIAWRRQARINTAWLAGIGTPLDEPSELYEVDLYDGLTKVRTVTGLTTPALTYTRAQQEADFGLPPAALTVRPVQVSSRVGRGAEGLGVFSFPRALLYARDWTDAATTPLTLTWPSGTSGSHTAVGGKYSITGGNTWTTMAAFGSPAPASTADVDLEVDLTVPATAGHAMGVVVRGGAVTAVNWGFPGYLFDIVPNAAGAGVVARIGKIAAGARTELASGMRPATVTLGSTVLRLRVVAKGSALRLYLDGELIASHSGDTTYTTGAIGFLTISAQAQTYDNLALYQAV